MANQEKRSGVMTTAWGVVIGFALLFGLICSGFAFLVFVGVGAGKLSEMRADQRNAAVDQSQSSK